MAVAAQPIPPMPGFGGAIPPMPSDVAPPSGGSIPPMPQEGGAPIAGAAGTSNAPPPSSLLRDVAGGVAAAGVQQIADVGKTIYTRATDPAYAPKITGYRKGPRGPLPIISAPDVPQAQVPGVTNFVNQTNPQGLIGQAAFGAGSMIPYALTGGAGDLVKAGELAPKAWAALKSAAGLTGLGATSGAGGYVGAQAAPLVNATPEQGEMAGSLAGGFGAAGAGWGLRKLLDAGADFAPVTPGMQTKQAAQTLKTMVPDYQQAQAVIQSRLANRALPTATGNIPLEANGAILPGGAAPTAAQLSGSGRLAKLEEGLKAMGAGAPLQATSDAQGAARAAAVRSLAPDEGAPGSLGEFLREARAQQDTVYGAQATKDQAAAQNTVAQQPGAAEEATPKAAGEDLQGAIAEPDAARKTAVTALYKQFEDRNPVINVSPLQNTVNDIETGIQNKKAGDVDLKEREFLARASDLAADPQATWAQMDQLRKEVGAYITDNSGEFGRGTANTSRMTQLKDGIDDAEASAADRLQAESPEWQSLYEKASAAYNPDDISKAKAGLEALSAKGKANEGTSQVSGTAGLSEQGHASAANFSSGAKGGQDRGNSPSNGGLVISERGPGVAPPQWTAEDSAGIKAVRAAHKTRMDLYYNKNIGPLLAKIPGNRFNLAGDEVLEKAVPDGAKGGAMAGAIKAVAADNPEILDHYQTAIGLSLRRAAMKDGVINRGALANWVKNKASLLQEFPEVAARVQKMATAQKYAEESAALRAQAMDTFKTKTISSLLSGDDPAVAMAHLLSGPPQEAALFARIVGRDQAAKAAAQKAMGDYIADQYLVPRNGIEGGDEAVRIAGLKQLMRDPSKVQNLRAVLGNEAPKMINKIIQEFELYNTGTLSKLSDNGSRTTPLGEVVKQISEPKTKLGRLIKDAANPIGDAIVAGAAHAGPAGTMATYLGASWLKGFLAKTNMSSAEILAKALADPKAFLELTKTIPKNPNVAAKFAQTAASIILSSAGRLGTAQPQTQGASQ